MSGFGLSDATKKVAEHARSLVELEVQLATAEMKRKAAALGVGIGLTGGAGVLAFLALCFLLAAAAAGIATTLPVWAALLIVFGALVMIAAILALIGITMLKKGSNPVPEQAVEEAKLTTEALRDADGA